MTLFRPTPNLAARACVLTAAVIAALGTSVRAQSQPPMLVLREGGIAAAIPVAAVELRGDKFVIKADVPGLVTGTEFPFATVDHVFGDKPPAINQGIAMILIGKPKEAIPVLDQVLAAHKDTAKLPGNFWLEAARAALVARALTNSPAACATLGKDISDATPAQGVDPFVAISKALNMPISAKLEERLTALKDLTADSLPPDLCAYATFFRAELLRENNDTAGALDAYMTISTRYPTGGMVISGVARFRAAEILIAKASPNADIGKLRRDEAVAMLKSALINTKGTEAAALVSKALNSTK